MCAMNISDTFPIFVLNLFDNDYIISTIKSVHKISYQKGKKNLANYVGI